MKSSIGEQKVHKSMNFVHDLATLELLAHEYCSIALQYCNLACNTTQDFTVNFGMHHKS